MAWSTSAVFSQFVLASHNRVAAFDWDSDTLKVALYNNTGTPDKTVAAASTAYNTGQWVTGNEVSQAGQWAAGGVTLTSPTVTTSSSTVTFDAADTASGSAATLTSVFGCLVYDSTLTTPVANQGVSFHYFGGSQGVTAGTFTVVWNASGLISAAV